MSWLLSKSVLYWMYDRDGHVTEEIHFWNTPDKKQKKHVSRNTPDSERHKKYITNRKYERSQRPVLGQAFAIVWKKIASSRCARNDGESGTGSLSGHYSQRQNRMERSKDHLSFRAVRKNVRRRIKISIFCFASPLDFRSEGDKGGDSPLRIARGDKGGDSPLRIARGWQSVCVLVSSDILSQL